jgi:hypothetical protein
MDRHSNADIVRALLYELVDCRRRERRTGKRKPH